ncbi:SdiA-regulated domain-containing protein [Viridibacterium curvum]|uniref:Ice-binding protein C-terminal domain-containing protein n=1 Tax=Viridibacterium curvum TaxID=1101404 RepID=A0ABP9QGH5_9RHOO
MNFTKLFAAVMAIGLSGAVSATSLNLSSYSVSGVYSLAINPGNGVSGLEGSAITYARDRGTLFYVGDEGTGVVEISKTGATLGAMAFNWSGTGSSKHDTEGLAYIGNGQLVVSEERLYDAYSFSYLAGGTASLVSAGVSISNDNVGNSGLEGIAYDSRNGSFVMVKQESPEDIRSGTLSFGNNLSGVANTSTLFNTSLMGLATLSDVATLSGVDAFVGTSAADNLLVLSLGSRKLIEVTRTGTVLSTLDLTNVLPDNGIEGVTIDESGTIYLIAEQDQTANAVANAASKLIVLTAPVPEPGTWAMLIAGLGLTGIAARRRK